MTIPTGSAKVEYETSGTCEEVCILLTRNLVDSTTSAYPVNVDEEVYTLTKTEGVEEACACTKLSVFGVAGKLKKAKLCVRDKLVETSLFVTVDSIEHVPHSVYMEEVLIPLTVLNRGPETVLKFETVLNTTVTCTYTNGRSDPLTDVSVYCETTDVELHAASSGSVYTSAYANEPVVPEFVGFIGSANNVSIFVTVSVLLCISSEGEAQEACNCKSSENSFDTFHNLLQ